MKAIQVNSAGGDFEVVEREIPEPSPAQVRIQVDACGVCHGDAAVREGSVPGIEYPRTPGHEVAGRVDAVGADVTEWEEGQRVGVGWHGGHCFVCDPCRRGEFTNCESGPPITGAHMDGGYAEYMVASREALARIPEGFDTVSAAPLVCAGLTAYNALRHSVAQPGDIVAIQGIGGVGHMGLQFAHAAGFETVAVSRGTDKEALAFDLGADHYIDAQMTAPAEELQAMGGARVIMATAPDSAAIEFLTGGLSGNGQLLPVAIPHEPVSLHLGEFINGCRSMQGWYSGHALDAQDTLEFSALRSIEPGIETFPLERAAEAYERMMAGEIRFRAVLRPGLQD